MRTEIIDWIQRIVALVLFLLAAFFVITHAWGCSTPARVLNAVEEAEYTLPYSFALDACRDEARKKPRAQQWEAYQTCEDLETRKLCERNPRMKAAWKRCLEVMP